MGCYRCGSERGTETRLCPRCAQKRIEERGMIRNAPRPSRKNSTLNMVITIIIGLMIGGVGLLLIAIHKVKTTAENQLETAFAGMMQEMEKEMGKGFNEAVSKATVTGATETEAKDDELNAEQYELPEGWVEEDDDNAKNAPLGSYGITKFNGVKKGHVIFNNNEDKDRKISQYIIQVDLSGRELAKEKIVYILKPGKNISKEFDPVKDAETIKCEESYKYDSRIIKDDWTDEINYKDLIGRKPWPRSPHFVSGSTFGSNDKYCKVRVTNLNDPISILIKLDRLDNKTNGAVLQTDRYIYNIGFNREITRSFPRIEGEKDCKVEVSIIQ